MAKSLIISIISSAIVAVGTAIFFGNAGPVQQFFAEHTLEAVVSCVLIVVLVGSIAWAISESLWRRSTAELRKSLDEAISERKKLEQENEALKEAHEECRIAAAGKSAREMIGSWDTASK